MCVVPVGAEAVAPVTVTDLGLKHGAVPAMPSGLAGWLDFGVFRRSGGQALSGSRSRGRGYVGDDDRWRALGDYVWSVSIHQSPRLLVPVDADGQIL